MIHQSLHVIFAACTAASLVYLLFAIRCVRRFSRAFGREARFQPPVSVLKPVCGLEHELYENLRSFCVQDYPQFEVIFGIADPGDAAVPVVRRLITEFPGRSLKLCLDPAVGGPNRKVSNLANACREARHGIILVADSDMRVGPDYLATVASGFADPAVGAVTCLYTGVSSGGLASDLGALFINEWFLPSALVANALKPLRYCFGATMGIRRNLLERMGGFDRLVWTLADDHVLGRLVAEMGYRVELAPYLVENVVQESGMPGLLAHEFRWAKTVRAVQPLGYTFSFISYAVPMALVNLAVAPMQISSWMLLAAAAALRFGMHAVVRRGLKSTSTHAGNLWILPRDLLSFGIWAASFFGRTVSWRQHKFSVDANGNLALQESQAP